VDQNRTTLVGRLTRNPEYHPPGIAGQEHCTFTLAINRVVSDRNGPKADYIPCSLWGPGARPFVEGRAKGDEVGVIGRIRVNYVQQPDGTSRLFFEIRVEEAHQGRKSLKNMQPKPETTPATQAVSTLQDEFAT
jgi:single-strand DNA-binding protein